MTSSLFSADTRAVLDAIAAEQDRVDAVEQPKLLDTIRRRTAPWTPTELVAACSSGYYAAPAAIGRMLYTGVRAVRPRTVFEFGTAYGFTAVHIAAALKDNGAGKLYTVDLHEGKCAAARDHLKEAGVDEYAEVITGEAVEVLSVFPALCAEPIDFLYLDGWADFYLDVVRAAEPHLRSGALVHADDTEKFAAGARPYLDHVREPANGYVSVGITDGQGLELSTFTGRSVRTSS
ncbi:O-methyltransferase [Streptomyces alfalfae]|uniref:O-methyltransferase n=1 Tax=Streptomyces alfalfae TaxID=1642299 RepID=UPI0028116595|nr:class I SAM-dependent methyltransferase [Streptomyces alfalfae]